MNLKRKEKSQIVRKHNYIHCIPVCQLPPPTWALARNVPPLPHDGEVGMPPPVAPPPSGGVKGLAGTPFGPNFTKTERFQKFVNKHIFSPNFSFHVNLARVWKILYSPQSTTRGGWAKNERKPALIGNQPRERQFLYNFDNFDSCKYQ